MPARSIPPLAALDLDPAHDPGSAVASARASDALAATPEELVGAPISGGADIRIGTASWTDPSMVRGGVFYPRGVSTAESRLRYYAEQFPVVEVDSSYYALPDRANAHLWAERTPPGFVFHVKAHALMTGQPTEVKRLPEGLVMHLPANVAKKVKLYAKDLPPELLDAVWAHFIDALSPLRDAGKLGGILMQYPRWFIPSPANKGLLADAAVRLEGIPATVELRNHMWFASTTSTQWTLDMLRDLGLTHVVVDGPQGLESSVPVVPAVTTPELAMIRFHGRRSATWEAPNVPTVERYRYLYSPKELEELMPVIEYAAQEARRTIVLFNNCYRNYGATNARQMIALLNASV
ncbi:MAG: DUF72 domain-containing protein [bacterium]